MNLTTTNEAALLGGRAIALRQRRRYLIYRFQRVSPMEVSPYTPHTVYYGSQYLHRSRDGGVTWEKISPDLTAHPDGTQGASGEPITRDATGEEVYSTLYAIRESPRAEGRHLDRLERRPGLRHARRRQDVDERHAEGLPPGGRIQNIEPSPHRAGTAYIAVYRYLLGDFAPYIYRTDDFGKTWTRLTDGKNGIAADEPTRVVREDPDRAGLLYAGTEFGMYISFDNGAHWQTFQLNLPNTPVTDIKIAHKDLILSTQGRGFWILDNLSPLHQLPERQTTRRQSSLHAARSHPHHRSGGRGGRGGLQHGAQIDYYVADGGPAIIKLEFLDATGKVVRSFTSAAPAPAGALRFDGACGRRRRRVAAAVPRARRAPREGARHAPLHLGSALSRVRGRAPSRPEGPNGPEAVPGKYSVRLTVGSFTATRPFTIVEDPRIVKDGVTEADLREQFDHNLKVRDLVSDVNKLVARVRAARSQYQGPGQTGLAQGSLRRPDHAGHPLQQAGAADPHHVPVHR